MTYFSALCVSENETTFTSTRPAALPAAIVSRSVTAAPAPLGLLCSVPRLALSLVSHGGDL